MIYILKSHENAEIFYFSLKERRRPSGRAYRGVGRHQRVVVTGGRNRLTVRRRRRRRRSRSGTAAAASSASSCSCSGRVVCRGSRPRPNAGFDGVNDVFGAMEDDAILRPMEERILPLLTDGLRVRLRRVIIALKTGLG